MDRIRKGTLRYGALSMSAMWCQPTDRSHDGLSRRALEPREPQTEKRTTENGGGAAERREKGREGGGGGRKTPEKTGANEPAR